MDPTLQPTLEQRISILEKKLEDPQPKPKDGWEKAQAIGSAVSSVLVAVIGLIVAFGVNRVLEQQKLDFGYAKELRELLGQWPSDATRDEARATALALASLGPHAIYPLLARLEEVQHPMMPSDFSPAA